MRKADRPEAVIVGAGLMGTWHARTLRRLGIGICSVVDEDLTRARALSADIPGCTAISSLDDIESASGSRVAHVCTPLQTHSALIDRMLNEDFHVLAEKPLVDSGDETARLLELARSRRRALCPIHQFPFQKGFLHSLRWLEKAGAIHHIESVACSAGAGEGDDAARDDVAADILPHPLSLMRQVVNADLAVVDWQVLHGGAGEIRAAGLVDQTSLNIVVSMAGRPTRNTLTMICERATFHIDLFHGFAIRESGAVSRRRKILRPFALATNSLLAAGGNLARRVAAGEAAYPGLANLFKKFYAALEDGDDGPIAPGAIMDVARARDSILVRLHG